MSTPAVLQGGTQRTVTRAFAPVANTAVGRSGTVAEGTGSRGAEAGLLPTALVAVTVKVYGVPLVRPVTVQVAAGSTAVQVLPSGEDVTV